MSPCFFQILICKWPTIFSFIDEKNDFEYSMLKCSIFYKVKSLSSYFSKDINICTYIIDYPNVCYKHDSQK